MNSSGQSKREMAKDAINAFFAEAEAEPLIIMRRYVSLESALRGAVIKRGDLIVSGLISGICSSLDDLDEELSTIEGDSLQAISALEEIDGEDSDAIDDANGVVESVNSSAGEARGSLESACDSLEMLRIALAIISE